jgi:hypothetical protein
MVLAAIWPSEFDAIFAIIARIFSDQVKIFAFDDKKFI